MNRSNRQILLAARPVGAPKESDFKLVETPVPSPGPREFLVRTLYLSLDPYMRGRMSEARSYAKPVEVGDVMTGGIVGEVVESQHPYFKVGEIVEGRLGWQEYALSDGRGLRKVDPALAPISTANGVLGMPGMTAYFGLLEVGRPVPGDTVVVSAASGAVGGVVGQIAKMGGCRVVGIAGRDDKCGYVRDALGFDAALNYKTEKDLAAAIAAACPHGVDVYFDNVGGPVSDAVLQNLALRARVVVCGTISTYNATEVPTGPRIQRHFLVNRARMEGLIVTDFEAKWPDAMRRMAAWVRDGRLKYREDIVDGLENAPKAFIGLLEGRNFGKLQVKVAEPSL